LSALECGGLPPLCCPQIVPDPKTGASSRTPNRLRTFFLFPERMEFSPIKSVEEPQTLNHGRGRFLGEVAAQGAKGTDIIAFLGSKFAGLASNDV